jgi:glycerophosphoryl diester phosphodiesterase
MTWILGKPIANRGLHDASRGAPENSLKAFADAVDSGYPIELDIHRLADGRIAVFHDLGLERMTGRPGSILDQTAQSLRGLLLAGTDQSVPLLAEALELVGGRVPVVVEIKNRGRAGGMERAVHEIVSGYAGDVAVVSFNPFSLAWFKENAPGIMRGQSAGLGKGARSAVHHWFVRRLILLNTVSRPHFVNYGLRSLPYSAVTRLRGAGMPIITWTARSEADAAKARAVADNFMFEGIRP